MRRWIELLGLVITILVAVGPDRPASAAEDDRTERKVLVELYTSQGCDMCPTAERVLGALAERDRRIVPIAFHVDYFNDSWKDVFSDLLYSQRQMTYNQLYTKPKDREDGVVTNIPSGENADRSLVARFPARRTKYDFIELDGKSRSTQRFSFEIEPAWKRQDLRLAVFVQDKRTGIVHQATDLPWRSTATAMPSAPPTAKASPGAR